MSNSGGGGGTIVRPPLNEQQKNGAACALCDWRPENEEADIRFMRAVGQLQDVEVMVCCRAVPQGCWIPTLPQLSALQDRGVRIYLSVAQSSRIAGAPDRVRDSEQGFGMLPSDPGYRGRLT